jgi:nucleoside-diphosphate-sugar epimerase
MREPPKVYAVNIYGTSTLLAVALIAGSRRRVQLSIAGVYGRPVCLMAKKTTPMPANGFERTELAAYILAEEAHKDTTLEYSILRPTDVIGTKIISRSLFALFSAVTRGRFCDFGPRGSTATC